jgi:hypothetical protein
LSRPSSVILAKFAPSDDDEDGWADRKTEAAEPEDVFFEGRYDRIVLS